MRHLLVCAALAVANVAAYARVFRHDFVYFDDQVQAALTALSEEPAEPPAGRESQASVEATLDKIDDNPQIEGT